MGGSKAGASVFQVLRLSFNWPNTFPQKLVFQNIYDTYMYICKMCKYILSSISLDPSELSVISRHGSLKNFRDFVILCFNNSSAVY